jgi:protein transport protein SEC13
VKRLVSAGCDNTAKVWGCSSGGWAQEALLQGHTDWVRDAAWAPNLGLPINTIATAGQDGQVGPLASAGQAARLSPWIFRHGWKA